MMRIGFIGFGRMGIPISEKIERSFGLASCYNRTRENIPTHLREKAKESPDVVLSTSDIVFMIVTDSTASMEILRKIGNSGKGKILIDMSTISYEQSIQNHQYAEELGLNYMDAPVIGSVPAAVNGSLAIVCGGKVDTFDMIRAILQSFTSKQIYCGKGGNGIGVKLVNNMVMGINMLAVAEGLALSRAIGLDDRTTTEALQRGGAASRILELKKEKMIKGDFSTQFSLEHQLKDIKYAVELQRSLKVPDFLTSMADSIYLLENEEHGKDDMCSVMEYYKKKRIND